ncbi:MAG: hypothetical protein ACHP9Z_25680, partial [Streptosporangiales bacterium]
MAEGLSPRAAVAVIQRPEAEQGREGSTMYQPYPAAEPPGEPERIEPPGPVRAAVKLMYAGAALSAITVIVTL